MGKIKSIKIHTASISLAVNMEKDNKVWLPIQPKRPNSRRKGADDSPKDTIELERDLPRKRAKNSEDACLTLCKFPMAVENERSAAELLLFILLAQVADLLVTQLPGLPVLYIPAQSREPFLRYSLRYLLRSKVPNAGMAIIGNSAVRGSSPLNYLSERQRPLVLSRTMLAVNFKTTRERKSSASPTSTPLWF